MMSKVVRSSTNQHISSRKDMRRACRPGVQGHRMPRTGRRFGGPSSCLMNNTWSQHVIFHRAQLGSKSEKPVGSTKGKLMDLESFRTYHGEHMATSTVAVTPSQRGFVSISTSPCRDCMDDMLAIACFECRFEDAKLIESEMSLFEIPIDYERAMASAAAGGDLISTRYFFVRGARDINRSMMCAAFNGRFDVVGEMRKLGANNITETIGAAMLGGVDMKRIVEVLRESSMVDVHVGEDVSVGS